MTTMRGRLCVVVGLLASAAIGRAQAPDPPLKAGRDPGGAAIVLLADGFDYRKPEVAGVLARDGEGEAIAFDAVDGDNRPFADVGRGTDGIIAAARYGGVRIVAVRVDLRDPASLAKGIGFAVATPAKIIVADFGVDDHQGIEVMAAAAAKFGDALFVVSRPGFAPDERTRLEARSNLVVLSNDGPETSAAQAIAIVFGCGAAASDAPRDRAEFLDRLRAGREAGPAACKANGGDAQGQKP
jgi:hypothetical protein